MKRSVAKSFLLILFLFSLINITKADWAPTGMAEVDNIAYTMTPEEVRYYSSYYGPKCPPYAVNKYYQGNLAVCNKFTEYIAADIASMDRKIDRLDRQIDCVRSGYKYCY